MQSEVVQGCCTSSPDSQERSCHPFCLYLSHLLSSILLELNFAPSMPLLSLWLTARLLSRVSSLTADDGSARDDAFVSDAAFFLLVCFVSSLDMWGYSSNWQQSVSLWPHVPHMVQDFRKTVDVWYICFLSHLFHFLMMSNRKEQTVYCSSSLSLSPSLLSLRLLSQTVCGQEASLRQLKASSSQTQSDFDDCSKTPLCSIPY